MSKDLFALTGLVVAKNYTCLSFWSDLPVGLWVRVDLLIAHSWPALVPLAQNIGTVVLFVVLVSF
jgi:hypothetical protein